MKRNYHRHSKLMNHNNNNHNNNNSFCNNNNHHRRLILKLVIGGCCVFVTLYMIFISHSWNRIDITTKISYRSFNRNKQMNETTKKIEKTITTDTNSMIPSKNSLTTTSAPTKPSRFYNSKSNNNSKSGQLPFPPIVVVDAMNIPGTTSTTIQQQQQQQQSYKRIYRILAYGDSLTAGTTSNYNQPLYPYSVYLEDALQQRIQQQKYDNSNNDNNDNIMIYVRHRGNPGMTVHEMVNNLDGERRGLRNAIHGIRNPSLSIVIILAGTNDLGTTLMSVLSTTTSSSSTSNKDDAIEIGAQKIYNNIISLHEMCYTNDIPYTIAIGIPPSGYQLRNHDAKQLVTIINNKLQQYANQSEIVVTTDSTTTTTGMNQLQQDPIRRRMTFVPFPFEYHNNNNDNNNDLQQYWDKDTLHLSQLGYEKLGISLVPYIERILNL